MLKNAIFTAPMAPLQVYDWPAMTHFGAFSPDLQALLPLAPKAQHHFLQEAKQHLPLATVLLSHIVTLYCDNTLGLRKQWQRVLWQLGDASGVPALVSCLTDPNANMRHAHVRL